MSVYIMITVGCLIGSAMFSGFENGMLAIRRARLDHALEQGSVLAKMIDWFLRHPAAMLGTILLGNNLCNCFAAVYYDEILKEMSIGFFELSARSAAVVSIAGSFVLTLIVLICGEITPKVWFRQNPFFRSRIMIGPIYVFYILTWPFVKALSWISNLLNRLLSGETNRAQSELALMREDFRMMLLESEEAGLLDREARSLLDNSLDFLNRRAGGVMTPLAKVETLTTATTLHEAINRATETGVSRFPVVEPETGRWLGIFSVHDAIYRIDRKMWDRQTVLKHIRPIISIDQAAGVNDVITIARHYQSPLLVVTNAKKEPIGVVTARDVVYPLFGDLDV